MNETQILKGYEYAKACYADIGIDVDAAIEKADKIPVSMHCWQGDDVIGFDGVGELTGGIATTGNYPGRARTADELRQDIRFAKALIPGATQLNMHACYAEKNGKQIDRDAYTIEQFQGWVDLAKELDMGVDFNPTHYVDITNQIEMKLKALEMHESQIKWMLEHDDIDFVDMVRTCSRYRGYQCGVAYAEGFRAYNVYPRHSTKHLLP